MPGKKESKLQHAMRLIDAGESPHAAAMLAGYKSSNAVYVELKKRRMMAEGLCPCCGQRINREVLKNG